MKRMIGVFSLVMLIFVCSLAVEIPAPSSFYDFEETEGTQVLDSGPAANNGEIVGEWIARADDGIVTNAGEAGKCIEFFEENAFGSLAYVVLPYQELMNSTNYTISTWMLYTGESPNWGYLFWADGITYVPELEDRHIDVWLHPYDQDLGVDCILHCQDGSQLRVANNVEDTGISLSDGEWHQVTVVLRNNIEFAIYIDGIWAMDDQGAATAEIVQNEGDDLYLGARPNDANEETAVKIVGCMDRVRFWDVALDEAQIEELFLREGPEGGTSAVSEYLKPTSFKLQQNYPNPFNPITTIEYDVSKAATVKLQVFDALGHQVIKLVDEFQNPGTYTMQFDAQNLASGIYFYTLSAGQQIESRKMMLVK